MLAYQNIVDRFLNIDAIPRNILVISEVTWCNKVGDLALFNKEFFFTNHLIFSTNSIVVSITSSKLISFA